MLRRFPHKYLQKSYVIANRVTSSGDDVFRDGKNHLSNLSIDCYFVWVRFQVCLGWLQNVKDQGDIASDTVLI